MNKQFVSISAAARQFGIARKTLRRVIDRTATPVFVDDLDRRRKLVRLVDIERLARPRAEETPVGLTR